MYKTIAIYFQFTILQKFLTLFLAVPLALLVKVPLSELPYFAIRSWIISATV